MLYPKISRDFEAQKIYDKSGKRGEVSSRLSWETACNLGFRGTLDECQRLIGAVSRQ